MRKLMLVLIGIATVLVAAGIWWTVRLNPLEKTTREQKESALHVGSKSCRNCHEDFYKLWAYNLGVLLTEDRLDEALDWCRKAHSLRPNEPKYIYTLGGINEKQGKSADAIAVYREAAAKANLPEADRARFSARALELSPP